MTVKIIKFSRTAYMRARYAKGFTNQLSCCHLSSSLQPVYDDIPPSPITGGLSSYDFHNRRLFWFDGAKIHIFFR